MAKKIDNYTRTQIVRWLTQRRTHREIVERFGVSKGAVARISAELHADTRQRRARAYAARTAPQSAPTSPAPQAPPQVDEPSVDWATALPADAWTWIEETIAVALDDALTAQRARLEEFAAEQATWPTCETCGARQAPEATR